MDNQLIIFAKNPVLGKVKTRLAATVGNQKALEIYKELLAYTCAICSKANANKFVFYSDFIDEQDLWNETKHKKKLQWGNDLGKRMANAFEETLNNDSKAIIIGTDCKELTPEIINQAFGALEYVDVVLGPAVDGGYYLIGMKNLNMNLFNDISWSTSQVLDQTINKMNKEKLSYLLLKTLSDIDTEEDLKRP
ncbi:MAG: rSAM/selenodomain-associated transferase 1 [Saprospiraceae bacterium]|jgi:rSAM/selenodomain-associated transferase 1